MYHDFLPLKKVLSLIDDDKKDLEKGTFVVFQDEIRLSEGFLLLLHDQKDLRKRQNVMYHDLPPLSEGVEVMCHDSVGLWQGDDALSEARPLPPKTNHTLRHRRIYNYCLTSKVLSHEKTL
jgi:hypothetical protein